MAASEAPRAIRRLEPSVVNRIAAGEVIQRPANAVKEMLENSLDAGATSVAVVLKDGGLKSIQITDNGHGIRREDLPILCERHTTSKLARFEDLQSIATLGFRGEALASISYVAHVSVTTMTEGQGHALKVSYRDGVMDAEGPKPAAGVKGTQITVEDLFFNVLSRRKALRSASDEYNRVLEVISRYAIFCEGVGLSCKKANDNSLDVRTQATFSRLDSIRTVFGASVAKDLLEVDEDLHLDAEQTSFKVRGYVSNANYSSKKMSFILFINGRLVDCSPLKKAVEAFYALHLPKNARPWVFLELRLPPEEVDVNVHPTKKEVGFLNEDSIIQKVVEVMEKRVLASTSTRAYSTQTLLPDAFTIKASQTAEEQDGATEKASYVDPKKLVRTDHNLAQGSLDAFVRPAKRKRVLSGTQELLMPIEWRGDPLEEGNHPATVPEETALSLTQRKAIRQRNPAEDCELTSVQEVLERIEESTNEGLKTICNEFTFVGMPDGAFVLLQHKTKLFLVNICEFSREMMFQQVFRRFGCFPMIKFREELNIRELLAMALEMDPDEGTGSQKDDNETEIDGIIMLLDEKAEMLKEYFSIDIDCTRKDDPVLRAMPQIISQYVPDTCFLPEFLLSLAKTVDWASEKACFLCIAKALSDLYAIHPETMAGTTNPDKDMDVQLEGGAQDRDESHRLVDCEAEWTVQHVVLPAVRLFLKPPSHLVQDKHILQVACLEQLYKVFERC